MADNADNLTIAAFNVERFGPTKCGNNEVMEVLTDVRSYSLSIIIPFSIIAMYDVIKSIASHIPP